MHDSLRSKRQPAKFLCINKVYLSRAIDRPCLALLTFSTHNYMNIYDQKKENHEAYIFIFLFFGNIYINYAYNEHNNIMSTRCAREILFLCCFFLIL